MSLALACRLAIVASTVLVDAVLASPAIGSEPSMSAGSTERSPAGQSDFGHLQLGFEKNIGQTDASVQWLARTAESTLYIAGNDATVQLNHIDKVQRKGVEIPSARSVALRMSLLNAQPARASTGEDLQPGKVNYLTGQDRSHWQKDVQMYGRVRLDEVYPGVSLLYHGERGQLEYDFVVAPNADPRRITLGFAGAKPGLAPNGDLLLPIPGDATVRFDKPVVYQLANGKPTPVASSYRLAKNGHVSFHLGRYDHRRELIIDPKLVFLGTLGAGNYPYATNLGQMTVDSTGAMYFIGTTNDPTYPVTSGAYQQVCGPATGSNASNGGVYCGTYGATSAYVSKISADGTTLVYSTYLSGGGGYEQGTSIAVDSSGVAYLLGATASTNFPITSDAFQSLCLPTSNPVFGPPIPAPISQCNNFGDGGGTEYTINGPVFFYAKLSADGSTLLYSSFLGGSAPAYPVATALDASGNWYVYGQTGVYLPNNVYTGAYGNGGNVQFPGISSNAYLAYSKAIYADQPSVLENINVAAVLSKFSNDGKTLLYGTFFGDNTNGLDFDPTSMAVGANGIAFIGGYTYASAIPTTSGAVKGGCTVPASTTFNGNTFVEGCTTADGYVVAFDTNKGGLLYSTRIGGSAPSQGSNIPNQKVLGLAADGNNNAYVTGYTYDQTFPVPASGYLNSCNVANPNNVTNCDAAYVLELNPTGTAILGGSFINGPAAYYESSVGYKVLLDSSNNVYLYGTSQDGYDTFPQVNPVQGPSYNSEIYIATMSSDLTKLLFSTRIGNPSLTGGNAYPVNGLALDPSNNIYFAASTQDPSFAATPGTYTTAVNSGTENHTFFGKISPVLGSDTTTLSVSPGNNVASGTSVTFTATVAGSGSTVPTGTITFKDGSSVLGTVSLNGAAQAILTTDSLPVGPHSVTATYSGDAADQGSTSGTQNVTITAATPVMTTTSVTASPPTATIKTPVTLRATVTPTGGGAATGTVSFYDGGTFLGSAPLSGGQAALTVSAGFAYGTQTISAVYGGSSADSGSSGVLGLSIAALRGDINHDGQVDKLDVALITGALNTRANPGDPRDLNDDGVINMLDARIDVTLCTYAGCATN